MTPRNKLHLNPPQKQQQKSRKRKKMDNPFASDFQLSKEICSLSEHAEERLGKKHSLITAKGNA
jgi:hypothetical protein